MEQNNDFTVWRYMSFAQFVDIIINKKLYFHFIDKQSDQTEGLVREVNSHPTIQKAIQLKRKSFGLNCWHKSEFESLLMWKAYGFGKQGIAIKSKMSLLNEFTHTNRDISIQNVCYNNLDELDGSFLDIFRFKRPEYISENEVRLIGSKKVNETEIAPGLRRYSLEKSSDTIHGFSVPIEPSQIIEKIYINSHDGWMMDIVKGLIKDKYFFEVILSTVS